MTYEVPQSEWKPFFDDLSKRRFQWRTKVEVIAEEIGDQTLDEGLPLNGIVAENNGSKWAIEILLGNERGRHQTHTIQDPTHIRYLPKTDDPGGIVEIEEMGERKTLVYIIEPLPLFFSSASANAK